MFGHHGSYLSIDGSSGAVLTVPIPPSVLRRVVGGVGLGTWVLTEETEAGFDPLGPGAALVIALSPLVGTPLTTSAKFAVVAKSPLTGRLCDALASSHFAIAAKRTGVDAIVIRGVREAPSVLFIDGQGREAPAIRFEPAGPLWGLSAKDAEGRIRRDFGPEWQVAAIGPAGEARIPFATLSHDGRHAGRGGLGAVLGSKRIKAVAVRGDRRVPVADPARTVALSRSLSSRSFGPATEKYRELGTVANLLVFNRFDALPSRNFREGHFDGAEKLASGALDPARRIARNSCASCTIGCEHVYATKSGGGARMEYESLFALGPMCGVEDPEIVIEAARLCDELGLDTISTGGTIAFVMDCFERGLIDGPPLRFGDGQGLIRAIATIPKREGIGQLLALGSRRAAEVIGGIAPGLAMHVKGLEMPGYDPRSLQAMALGLAVGTRGADHNRSGAYEADFSEGVNRRRGDLESVRRAIAAEDRSAVMDSLILCKFVRGVFADFFAEATELLEAVTGWDITADELHQVGRRVIASKRAFNLREGWTRSEDTLPASLLTDGPDTDDAPGLPKKRLEGMIDAYYRERAEESRGVFLPSEPTAAIGLPGPGRPAGG